MEVIETVLKNMDRTVAEGHHCKKRKLNMTLQGFPRGEEISGMMLKEWPVQHTNQAMLQCRDTPR